MTYPFFSCCFAHASRASTTASLALLTCDPASARTRRQRSVGTRTLLTVISTVVSLGRLHSLARDGGTP
jgi:hypothetical protein